MENHFPKFFEFFKDYQDTYVLIGGQAASILIEESGGKPRATKDLDIIVIFENITQQFVDRFKEFICQYHYAPNGHKDDNRKYYYRFRTNKNSDVPEIIELFSKAPIDFQLADPTTVEIPLPDEQESLSAISLDADYYSLLKQGIEISSYVNGPLLKTEYLILFKAKAQLDIARQLEANEQVNHRDKMKHKKDIFNLLDTLEDSDFIPSDTVPDQVKRDFNDYIEWLENQPKLGNEIAKRDLPRFGRSPIKSAEKVIDALYNLIR